MAAKKSPAKSAPKKAAKAPAKKATPAKKAAPAKKAIKPAPKKVVSKPAAKKAAKPTPKKAVAKPVAKKVAKPAPKKSAAKPVAKKVAKPASNKPVKPAPVKKQEVKPTAKKVEAPAPVRKPQPKNPKDIKIAPVKALAVPKISTKSAKKYQPDFTKSVLDYQKADPGAPMVRYSDSDLREFKDIILSKLESAKKELHFLQSLITRKDETGGDESENRYMTMEDGSLSMEREQLSQMASRQITFIDHLEKALIRIENKTYGICRVTGKLIDKARLRAVPHATLSIEAKLGNVK